MSCCVVSYSVVSCHAVLSCHIVLLYHEMSVVLCHVVLCCLLSVSCGLKCHVAMYFNAYNNYINSYITTCMCSHVFYLHRCRILSIHSSEGSCDIPSYKPMSLPYVCGICEHQNVSNDDKGVENGS